MRKFLSNKEKRELIKELDLYKVKFNKKDKLEVIDNKFWLVNNECWFFRYDNMIVPSLRFLHKHENILKKVMVDKGAVKFVVKGADIMRPGIIELSEEITKGNLVIIEEETNNKIIAVGIALFNGEEIKKQETGKVIKNIHRIGDEVWSLA